MMTKKDYEYLAARLRHYARVHEQGLGKAISGEVDLERQAADAIDALLELVERRANIVRVETPLGTLTALESGYGPENPGIFVSVWRPGVYIGLPLALVECTGEHGTEGKQFVTRVYSDAMKNESDSPVVHTGIEKYFGKETANG